MKLIQVLSIFIMLFSLLVNTQARAKNKLKWTTYGVEPCSKVLSIHAQILVEGNKISGPPEVWTLIGWVSGFATAANSAIGSPPNYFKSMTDLDMVHWVASWCRDNPDHDLDKAMRVLAIKYRPF